MKRHGSWITTALIAVAAIFGFSFLPTSKAPEATENQETVTQPAERPIVRSTTLFVPEKMKKSPCWEIEKSVLIFGEDSGSGNGSQPTKAINSKEPANHEKAEDKNADGKSQHEKKGDAAAPGSCFDDGKPLTPLRPMENVRFLIATLPDPVHTHFPLLFDRLTEALQQAAQDQGYNYDSSWLPWVPSQSSTGVKSSSSGDRTRTTGMLAQPGVLVFRRSTPPKATYTGTDKGISQPPPPYEAGLIVFVVGENPTGGIDTEQLKNAFDWIEVLGGEEAKQHSGILGPYFSGSLPSLYQGLVRSGIVGTATASKAGCKNGEKSGAACASGRAQATTATNQQPPSQKTAAPATTAEQAQPQPIPKTFAIFSGSVTSKSGMDWFDAELKNSSARFFSFQQNDDNTIDSYCRYLTNQGYDVGLLAIISEDETAYGFSLNRTKSLPDCEVTLQSDDKPAETHGPLYAYYPRDIAALRSAYSQQQPSGTSKSSGTSATNLPFDLAEPATRERDTISTFAERQSTLSQEAELFGVANLFAAHGIQFIVLRSSNTLDQIFLTRFFSQVYPHARIVLTSADLLFRKSSDTVGFRGTQMLTTYPLLTQEQDWTHWQSPESRHSHRAFPEDTAEGLYLAARLLIDASWGPAGVPDAGDKGNPLKLRDDSITVQDYAPPSWLFEKKPGTCSSDLIQRGTDKDARIAVVTRPPTWLSVVGSGQLWSVAVLGSCIPEPKRFPFYMGPVPTPPDGEKPQDTLPWVQTNSAAEKSPYLPVPLAMFLSCAVVLGWSIWHFFCCLFGSHLSSIRLGKRKLSPSSFRSLAYFAPTPRRQHRVLIFIGCFLMFTLAVEISLVTGLLHRPFSLEHPVRVILYCILLGVLPLLALLANYRTYLPPEWGRKKVGDACVNGKPSKAAPKFDVPLMVRGAVFLITTAFAFFWVFKGWVVPVLARERAHSQTGAV